MASSLSSSSSSIYDLLMHSTNTPVLMLTATAAIVGLIVAFPSDQARRAILVMVVVMGTWIVLAQREKARTDGHADDVATLELADTFDDADTADVMTVTPVLSGGATYQTRLASAGTSAIALHGDVQRALAALSIMHRRDARSPGSLQAAVSTVDTFLRRYHNTLMAPRDSLQARLDVPLLLDARREALNALHALEYGVSHSNVGPIRAAVEVVRAVCARSLRIVHNKHGKALRGIVMTAPYPAIDPLMDPHMVD